MKTINRTLVQCLKLLQDGQFHDGTSLGTQLGITRTAVWKIMKKLEQYGIAIEAQKAKGYAIMEPLILLEKKKINQSLDHKIALDLFEEIDSTNDYLKQFCNGDPSRGLRVCIAETQTHGKGRFHRSWYSPFGQNIYLSLLFPFTGDVTALSGLSLVVGLAVCQAIQSLETFKEPVYLKWPNDLICDHQKLAGSLIEVLGEASGNSDVIIGIGLNVNMLTGSIVPAHGWTSLRKVNGYYYDRNPLCSAIIKTLLLSLERFRQKGFKDFLSDWKAADYLYSKDIQLKSGAYQFQGKMQGVNTEGYLLLQLADGTTKAFSSGDTSLSLG